MPDVPHGRFVWFDLMTTDPEAAKSFYSDLIGWTITPFAMEGMDRPYEMWTAHETPLGGVMPLPDEAKKQGAPPHWLGYIGTANVDASVAKATKQDGKVFVPGQDIPTVGRFAVLADPAGAVFAVYESTGDWAGHPGAARDGEVSWCELMTEDREKTFDFYGKVFGWKKTEAMDMGEMGVYQMFSAKEGPVMGGMMNKPPEVPVCAWLFYFQVPDADAGAKKAKKLGGQVVHGPMDVPGGGRIVVCMDPQGAAFALHTPV